MAAHKINPHCLELPQETKTKQMEGWGFKVLNMYVAYIYIVTWG